MLPPKDRQRGGGKGTRQKTAAQKAGGKAVGCERRHVVEYEKQAVLWRSARAEDVPHVGAGIESGKKISRSY